MIKLVRQAVRLAAEPGSAPRRRTAGGAYPGHTNVSAPQKILGSFWNGVICHVGLIDGLRLGGSVVREEADLFECFLWAWWVTGEDSGVDEGLENGVWDDGDLESGWADEPVGPGVEGGADSSDEVEVDPAVGDFDERHVGFLSVAGWWMGLCEQRCVGSGQACDEGC